MANNIHYVLAGVRRKKFVRLTFARTNWLSHFCDNRCFYYALAMLKSDLHFLYLYFLYFTWNGWLVIVLAMCSTRNLSFVRQNSAH